MNVHTKIGFLVLDLLPKNQPNLKLTLLSCIPPVPYDKIKASAREEIQSMKARYLNPFTDFGFKKRFGEEASKPLLLDFLNALLPLETLITSLQFLKAKQIGTIKGVL